MSVVGMNLLAWVIVFLMLERSVNSLSEKSSLCILECLGGFKHSCSQQNCRAVCRGNESDVGKEVLNDSLKL